MNWFLIIMGFIFVVIEIMGVICIISINNSSKELDKKQNEIEKIDKEISKIIKEIINRSNTIIKMQEEFLKEVEKDENKN